LLNTISGSITIEDHAFLGHGVALLTGTHDIRRTGRDRQLAVPDEGRDIVIESGAWVASRAILIGPCRIGANAVVAAGTLVAADVPPSAIVSGSPARLVGRVDDRRVLPEHVRLITHVGTISAHAGDTIMTPQLRASGSWDEPDCRLLESHLAPGGVVIDVGANIGYMTLIAARAVGPTGTVIAIEPHPDNVALLRDNLARNGMAKRVRVVSAAAWDAPGTVDLAECEDNTGDHRVETLTNERSVLQVEAVTLDDVVPDSLHVDLIKLDTQGTEHHVLEGAQTVLARDRPIVLSEFWPDGLRERGEDPRAVMQRFRELGYAIEIPDAPQLDGLDDAALIEAVHKSGPGPNFGFATLRLAPR
jgi:FkbM family methyltransferase